jgi:hypothetical protein
LPSVFNKLPIHDPNKVSPNPFRRFWALFFLDFLPIFLPLPKLNDASKIHWEQLKQFLHFPTGVPSDNTLGRVLKRLLLADLQQAFAAFLNALLPETPLVAAVDGKAAKQMTDDNGDPLLILNVFAQHLKLHLASWSVRGDKTNEPGCLKNHLEELFTMYPCLKLLTGDAIYAQRPLLEAIQDYHRNYLVQVKENQPKVLEQMKLMFADAPQQEPSHQKTSKKRGAWRFADCG